MIKFLKEAMDACNFEVGSKGEIGSKRKCLYEKEEKAIDI